MRREIVAIFLLGATLHGVASASVPTSPHGRSGADGCLSCHQPSIFETPLLPGQAHLLAPSIDDLCLSCHRSVPGATSPIRERCVHPSDRDACSAKYPPSLLPVYAGAITCSTCHGHDRRSPKDHRRLRLIQFQGEGIRFDPLCRDCHQ